MNPRSISINKRETTYAEFQKNLKLIKIILKKNQT